jgi:hypothetical protein
LLHYLKRCCSISIGNLKAQFIKDLSGDGFGYSPILSSSFFMFLSLSSSLVYFYFLISLSSHSQNKENEISAPFDNVVSNLLSQLTKANKRERIWRDHI